MVDGSRGQDGFGLVVAEGRDGFFVVDESIIFHQHVGETVEMIQFHLYKRNMIRRTGQGKRVGYHRVGVLLSEGIRDGFFVVDESVILHQHVGETVEMIQFHLYKREMIRRTGQGKRVGYHRVGVLLSEGIRDGFFVVDESVILHQHVGETVEVIKFHLTICIEKERILYIIRNKSM